ncbi:MAG: hypothetical protein HN692_02085, partial [Candidatus Cloacimonetes bacterium]|nr:hypothetical protein [Candidatus Cloacimonadota bacterium]
MKKATIILIISICAITLFADWSIEQKVFAGDGSGEDYFGQSVSISGEYAIVGAPLKNFPLGAAYLHKRINNQWLEIEKIQASDSTNTQGFGSSVFINGDYMMISANHYYSNSSGSTYIYHNDGENWNEVDIITASGSPICDQYGCSVGITENGEYAIVGAYNDDENGENSGAVYVYQQINSEWNLQTKIMAYDGSLQDLFGCSVFITNNLIFVSAINDDDNGEESGSVYIYENNGTNWEFHSKIIASHNTSNDQFGVSISVCGDFLIVGTSCYDQGEAYIFHFDGENWTEVANLTASDGFDYDHFGRSVSISEDYAVIGACDCPDVGMSASAYFFEKEGTDWNELNKLTIDNWGAFGYSVSISGENAIVGANLDFGVSNATGAVYFISNDGTSIDQEIITYPQYNALISNYPNPFNPITTISFSLTTNLHEKARIEIFNIKGQ